MEAKLRLTPEWPVQGSLAWQLLNYDRPYSSKRHEKRNGPIRVLHLLSQQPGKTGSGVYLQALVQQGAEDGLDQKIIVGIPSEFSELSIGSIEVLLLHNLCKILRS